MTLINAAGADGTMLIDETMVDDKTAIAEATKLQSERNVLAAKLGLRRAAEYSAAGYSTIDAAFCRLTPAEAALRARRPGSPINSALAKPPKPDRLRASLEDA